MLRTFQLRSYQLWLFYGSILSVGLRFISLCFGMGMYDNDLKQSKINCKPSFRGLDRIEPRQLRKLSY